MTTLKQYLVIFLAFSGSVFWAVTLYGYLGSDDERVKVYNCDIAEISPDYPAEVRDECRKLKSGRSIST